jgi:hypothetical protein
MSKAALAVLALLAGSATIEKAAALPDALADSITCEEWVRDSDGTVRCQWWIKCNEYGCRRTGSPLREHVGDRLRNPNVHLATCYQTTTCTPRCYGWPGAQTCTQECRTSTRCY